MDEAKTVDNTTVRGTLREWLQYNAEINELRQKLAEANKRIAELEKELEDMETDLNTAEDLAIYGPDGI